MDDSTERTRLAISFPGDAGNLDRQDAYRAVLILQEISAVITAADAELPELCRQPYEPPPKMTAAALRDDDPVVATRAAVEDFHKMRWLVTHLTGLIRRALDYTERSYRPFLALACLRRLIAFNPALYAVLGYLQNLATTAGQTTLVVDLLDEATRRLPALDTNVVIQVGIQDWPATAERIARGRLRGLPGILFNTMPKSGSMYVSDTLARGLDVPAVPIAVASYTLRDHVVPASAQRLDRGGAICQEHIHPSVANVASLRLAKIERLVVHMRDPRQATLSNLHHVAKRYEEVAAFMEPIYPSLYPRWPFASRAAWMLDHYFPELIDWVRGWVEIADDPASGIEVYFTHYEDLHHDEEGIIASILDFYGVARDIFDWQTKTERNERTHFRRGLTDEWREVFTAEQQATMWQQIPRDIAERFGWSK